MCHEFREARCELPAQCQYATLDRFLVSARYVPTAYDYFAHEECRIGAVCSRVLGLVGLERRVYPCWLDDMYHEIEGAVVVGEVGRLRDNVADFLQVVYAAFGYIEGYDCSASACDSIFDLCRRLAILLN